MLPRIADMLGRKPAKPQPQIPKFQSVEYKSNEIPLPPTFLTTPPAKPITFHQIDFASSPLPKYEGHTAIILENVLSPEECNELLSLAEASVPRGEGSSAWRPALVSVGVGLEAAAPGYRESDRIIWDQQEVVNRIWERCAKVEGLVELIETPPEDKYWRNGKWELRRCNERMRFLKYSKGQYFRSHCDAPYHYQKEGRTFMTHYTLHLYLNDNVESDPKSQLKGGATAFLSKDKKTKMDVNPKAGSVLIFQHMGLLHEGSEVKSGVKFTMRTDILYEFVPGEEKEEEG